MKIPFWELLKTIRPLPWPVNSKVAENGALTVEQMEATRIFRRHAANLMPRFVSGATKIRAAMKEGGFGHAIWCNFQHPKCDRCNCGVADILSSLRDAEEIEVAD